MCLTVALKFAEDIRKKYNRWKNWWNRKSKHLET